jgi:hypothetical protein
MQQIKNRMESQQKNKRKKIYMAEVLPNLHLIFKRKNFYYFFLFPPLYCLKLLANYWHNVVHETHIYFTLHLFSLEHT